MERRIVLGSGSAPDGEGSVSGWGRPASPCGVSARLDSARRSLLGCLRLEGAARPWLLPAAAALFLMVGADVRALAPAGGRAPAQRPVPAGSPIDRAEAVRRGSCESRKDLDDLLARLEDPEPLVRGTALSRLLAAPREWVVEALGSAPASSRGVGTERLMAVLALEDPSLVRHWGICSAVAGQEDPWLRSVLAGVCVAGGRPGGEELARMATDSHWSVRARVALALAGKGDAEARRWLARLSRDPHPTVRHAARSGEAGAERVSGLQVKEHSR
ncbi:MAG: HEAT repeat domain-containing protein [Acidobacteriota bacterium]|nr:HEAT repeat domain-containing protein [Acidobacteriota bacterium]MDQ7088201.1 HEAT repeat domain-containing protein [Acidobacteriota bacterium]